LNLGSEFHYRNLFAFAPVGIWEADCTALEAWFDQLRAAGVTDLGSFLETDPQQVFYGLSLVAIRSANQASLEFYGANNEQHLLENASRLLATVPLPSLKEAFVARWNGAVSFQMETHISTLHGRRIHGLVGVSVPREANRLDYSRIILTFTDITERKRAEDSLRQSEERLRRALGVLRESEQFYRTLIETLPVTVVLADPAGRVTYISPAAKEMFGLAPGEGIGTLPTDWIAPEHHEVVRHRMRQVLVELRPQPPIEYKMFKRDRTHLWAQVTSAPVLDAEGHLQGVVTVCQDITARRQAEDALRENEARFRLAQQAARAGTWDVDLSTGQAFVSEETWGLWGVEPRDDPRSFDWLAAIYPEDRPLAETTMRQAVQTSGDASLEYRITWPDGQVRWHHARGRTLADAEGRPVRLVGITTDITGRKQAEAEIKRLNETLEQRVIQRTAQLRALASELAQAEQRERRRLAQILHDHLQQLLVAAKLKTGMLSRRIQDEGMTRLLRQINELLEESIAQSRSLTVELSPPVLYDRGLAGGLEWLARQFEEKHELRVGVEFDPEAEPIDEGTRVFLFQAIRELLLNIVKHAQASSAHISLARHGEDRLRVEVSDTGSGFNPAALENREPAQGFGLFHIRERLEVIGGRVEVEAAPGRGTRVVIDVPRGQAISPAGRSRKTVAAVSTAALNSGLVVTEPLSGQKSVRVLVADDHRVVREGLITMLQEQPAIKVIGEAADGQQALDLSLRMKPEVVLMDISMPVLDGIEATRRIAQALPEVRVIGLSMHAREDMALAMREAGAVAYLSKSEAADTLIATILNQADEARKPR
jgi:PAS domain S-box-containing protein